jgi:hypothetical protein
MAEIEKFKEISNFMGRYQISNFGTVKSFAKNREGSILWQRIDKYGYNEVCLWMKQKVYYKKVHRLVAEAFLKNNENKTEVNHLDTIKTNNKVSNLEWATSQENSDHKLINNLQPKGESHYAFGKFGANHKSAKLVLDDATGIFYECVKEAAIAKGVKYKTLVGKLCGNDNNNTTLRYV